MKPMTEEVAAAAPTVQSETIFVTGATGYVGGRLVPLLLEAGYQSEMPCTRAAKT